MRVEASNVQHSLEMFQEVALMIIILVVLLIEHHMKHEMKIVAMEIMVVIHDLILKQVIIEILDMILAI